VTIDRARSSSWARAWTSCDATSRTGSAACSPSGHAQLARLESDLANIWVQLSSASDGLSILPWGDPGGRDGRGTSPSAVSLTPDRGDVRRSLREVETKPERAPDACPRSHVGAGRQAKPKCIEALFPPKVRPRSARRPAWPDPSSVRRGALSGARTSTPPGSPILDRRGEQRRGAREK
jgi:hypothetical protein